MHGKTIFIVILLFITNTFAVAQKRNNGANINAFKRGAFQVGVAGNYTLGTQKMIYGYPGTYNVSRDSVANLSHYGATASAGYFVSRNILIGANLNHTWQARPSTAVASDSSTATHFSASALLRAYVPLTTKAAIYVEGEFGYANNTVNTVFYAPELGITKVSYMGASNTSGFGGAVSVGTVIFLNEKCSIDAGVRYYTTTTKGGTLSIYPQYANTLYSPTYLTRNGFGARLGLQFFLFN